MGRCLSLEASLRLLVLSVPGSRPTGSAARDWRGWGPRGRQGPGSAWPLTVPLLSVSHLDQDLEQKLSLQEQDAAIVKNMRSELVRLPTMERELRQLREENACLR